MNEITGPTRRDFMKAVSCMPLAGQVLPVLGDDRTADVAAGPFIHLHVHSHYSLLNALGSVEELVQKTKELGMNALALTDHGNLYGAVEFHQAARKAGINPILGYEAYIKEGNGPGDVYHLTLLAQNRTGFQNLVKLSSAAFLNSDQPKPCIDRTLVEAHAAGIICLSGCGKGELSRAVLAGNLNHARRIAGWFHRLFGDRYFIEIQNNGIDTQRQALQGLADLARQIGVPTVATCDVHYLNREDAAAHDVLLCIAEGKQEDALPRKKFGSDEFYLKAPAEVYASFPDHSDAVRRTQEIANRVDTDLDISKRPYPTIGTPPDSSSSAYLRTLCTDGLRERYAGIAEMCQDGSLSGTVQHRLNQELQMIEKLGLVDYFLLLWDIVRYAQDHGIPATVHGSAASFLVVYGLGLSQICPLKHGLLFERYLRPGKAQPPSDPIATDRDGREAIIRYLRGKHGPDRVAAIGAFDEPGFDDTLRTVARTLGMDHSRCEHIMRIACGTSGYATKDGMETDPVLKKAYMDDERFREVWDIAAKLDGNLYSVDGHTAGIVITNGPVSDHVPVQTDRAAKTFGPDAPVFRTQWCAREIERVGQPWVDVWALKLMAVMKKAVTLIAENGKGHLDLDLIPENDRPTYDMFQRGDTAGVDGLEREESQAFLRRLQPTTFDELAAATVLGYLGVSAAIYIRRKHGHEKIRYSHPALEAILAETHGVPIYEEQGMRILHDIGGIDYGSGWGYLKAKQRLDTTSNERTANDFLAGAKERSVEDSLAREILEMLTFNGCRLHCKARCVANARLAYQMAYLKAHYRKEFEEARSAREEVVPDVVV